MRGAHRREYIGLCQFGDGVPWVGEGVLVCKFLSSLFILPSTTAYQIITLLQRSVNMYLAHTYGRYPASATAVSKVLQYISDEVLPLAGKPLYDYLGLGDLPFQRFDF